MTIKHFAIRLIAILSLSVAAGTVVHATTIFTETTDFSDNPLTPTMLPLGITGVDGSVDGSIGAIDVADFFEFQGLTGGSHFVLTAQKVPDLTLISLGIEILNDAGVVLLGPTGLDTGGTIQTFSGTVPLDGNLVVGIGVAAVAQGQGIQGAGSQSPTSTAFYAVTLVPEPNTLAIIGLTLAGMLSLRRKKS